MPFSAVVQEKARKPLRVIDVNASDFADEWPEKPSDKVPVGLRLISESEMLTARAVANKRATETSGTLADQIAAFNDALMAWAVAVGTCQPEDVTAPWMAAAADNIPLALTSRGMRRIYDEIERLHTDASPLHHEASDAELDQLAARLVSRLWTRNLSEAAQKRSRRYLGFVIAEMGDDFVDVDEAAK